MDDAQIAAKDQLSSIPRCYPSCVLGQSHQDLRLVNGLGGDLPLSFRDPPTFSPSIKITSSC